VKVRRRVKWILLVACLVVAPACSSSNEQSAQSAPTSSTARAEHRGGVPDGYPLDHDVVAPLVISALGDDPIPVTGTDGKVHVVYELEILNAAPRPATITSIDTLAGGADGRVVATIGADEVKARSLLLAAYGAPFTEIPVGRTAVVLLDDVFASRKDVPASSNHRIQATFGAAPSAELEPDAARYPDSVTQIGGVVHASNERPVVLGPPLAGGGWVAGNGCCGNSSHRGAVQPSAGRLNGTERFAIDFVRLDPDAGGAVTFRGDGTKNDDYFAYGAPLLAVADGKVVSVQSDVPDSTPQHAPTVDEIEQLGGNHVILDIGAGNYVYYAHLIPGSEMVKVGDTVKRGQVIGKLGNSGNSSEAHLHLHVTRAPLPLAGDNVPYVFDRFTYVGTVVGDRVQAGPHAGERTRQLPLVDSVIDFPSS
jgi:murein DD-endopeptidase MepM/ murein hydrolase activator NlpD